MTMSGTLTAAGYMWCMVEKAGTAPAKKTARLLSANASSNASSNATKANDTATKKNDTKTTPVTPDAYADLRK